MIFQKKDKNKKKTIRKFFPTSPLEVLALQNFFEEMSEKGFLVVERSGAFYKFIESEPKKRRFIVDYFSKASSFAYRPEGETLDYMEYCKAAGWTHGFNNGKMQCFYTEDMETPEIETDDEFKFKSIIKAEISERIMLWVLGLFYIYLGREILFNTLTHYLSWRNFFSSPTSLRFFLLFTGFIIISGSNFIFFMWFYIKNKKQLNKGESLKLYTPEQGKRRMRNNKIVIGIFAFLLILVSVQNSAQLVISLIVVMFYITVNLVLKRFMKSKYSSGKRILGFTIVLTIVVLQLSNLFILSGFYSIGKSGGAVVLEDGSTVHYETDPVPINLSDLGYTNDGDLDLLEETFYKENKTLLAFEKEFSSHYFSSVDYHKNLRIDKVFPFYWVIVFESPIDGILDHYISLFKKNEAITPLLETTYPKLLDQGYTGYWTNNGAKGGELTWLMLIKGDTTILISSHEILSEENIMLILSHS